MAWHDRDYARNPMGYQGPVRPVFRPSLRGRSIVTILIAVNVVVYVLCTLEAGRNPVYASNIFVWCAMMVDAVKQGQIWRLITSDYLHWSGWHIFVNMLGLHFLGRPLERDWGPKKFFAVYTLAGLIGSLFYMLLTEIGWLQPGIAAGASGCVLGLLGACAVRYPQAKVFIYFLFPIKIRTAAFVFAGFYVLNLWTRGDNAGGDACHLAGLAFGVWWAMKGDRWWASTNWRLPFSLRSRNPKSRGFARKIADRREDEETIDRILKKVYEGGIHSLTESEKRALQAATDRQRQREAHAGRVDRL